MNSGRLDNDRVRLRNRGAFPSPESVRKILYLAIERISKKWKRPIKDWVAALNHFTVVFEGRIPE